MESSKVINGERFEKKCAKCKSYWAINFLHRQHTVTKSQISKNNEMIKNARGKQLNGTIEPLFVIPKQS